MPWRYMQMGYILRMPFILHAAHIAKNSLLSMIVDFEGVRQS